VDAIQTRTEMLSTRHPQQARHRGVRRRLEQIEEAAIAVDARCPRCPARAARCDRSTGGFYIDIIPKRDEAARFGLTVGDINDVVESAIGGLKVRRPSRAAAVPDQRAATRARSGTIRRCRGIL